MISNNNYEYVTVIKIVSTIRVIIKSMFILLKKIYLKRFYWDLKNEILIDLLNTKYVNNKYFYTYI